jgi:Protein of unknown function (DUF3225)
VKINDPAVVAEVTAAFMAYETALNDNDVPALVEWFWRSPLTIRFGLAENLYGHDAISAFRRARPAVDIRRAIANTVITTYGSDFATANTEFTKLDSGRRGRQSQTWMRTADGWRVVSAHVSDFPAHD